MDMSEGPLWALFWMTFWLSVALAICWPFLVVVVCWSTIPAIGLSLLVLLVGLRMSARALRSPETIQTIMKPELTGARLSWVVNEYEMERFARRSAALAVAAAFAVALLWIDLRVVAFDRRGLFDHVETTGGVAIARSLILLLAHAMPIMGVVKVVASWESRKRFLRAVGEEAHDLALRLTTTLRCDELRRLEGLVSSLASELGVDFPTGFASQVERFAHARAVSLLCDAAPLEAFIASQVSEAQVTASEMQRARDDYAAVMSLYSAASLEVNKTGLMPLIKELDYDYAGLSSEALRSLLTQRKWSDFHDVLGSIVEDIERLRQLAARAQADMLDAGVEAYQDGTEEEKACGVLGVPPTATNDQVKKAYRTLVSIWHPDAGAVSDDSRIKEINRAYELLKSRRGIR